MPTWDRSSLRFLHLLYFIFISLLCFAQTWLNAVIDNNLVSNICRGWSHFARVICCVHSIYKLNIIFQIYSLLFRAGFSPILAFQLSRLVVKLLLTMNWDESAVKI